MWEGLLRLVLLNHRQTRISYTISFDKKVPKPHEVTESKEEARYKLNLPKNPTTTFCLTILSNLKFTCFFGSNLSWEGQQKRFTRLLVYSQSLLAPRWSHVQVGGIFDNFKYTLYSYTPDCAPLTDLHNINAKWKQHLLVIGSCVFTYVRAKFVIYSGICFTVQEVIFIF